MSERKPYRNFKKREPVIPIEEKIKQFIIRNSKNGYFTKVSTIPFKFEISESKVWDIVGELLIDGSIESIHDENTGEMKLCEVEKTYFIMDLDMKRKREKFKSFKKKPKEKLK
ncbi:MAG: hypothetical protein ISR80_04805 [Nitrosopumilus sp.]|nr:hypothetical protein [Nitrosopumilus sp.]MDC4231729.1 hypothetical protein [Nitrosopumilus sp.]